MSIARPSSDTWYIHIDSFFTFRSYIRNPIKFLNELCVYTTNHPCFWGKKGKRNHDDVDSSTFFIGSRNQSGCWWWPDEERRRPLTNSSAGQKWAGKVQYWPKSFPLFALKVWIIKGFFFFLCWAKAKAKEQSYGFILFSSSSISLLASHTGVLLCTLVFNQSEKFG